MVRKELRVLYLTPERLAKSKLVTCSLQLGAMVVGKCFKNIAYILYCIL